MSKEVDMMDKANNSLTTSVGSQADSLTRRDEIAKYWGAFDAVASGSNSGSNAEKCNSRRNSPTEKLGRTFTEKTKGKQNFYNFNDLAVFNELDISTFLFDHYTKKVVWANSKALQMYDMKLEDLVKLSFDYSTDFLAFVNNMIAENCCESAECEVIALPGLEGQPSPENCDSVYNIKMKKFWIYNGSKDLVLRNSKEFKECRCFCLASVQPVQSFQTSFGTMQESLRALEMLKSLPIFSLLFSYDGQTLLMANPRAVEFYRGTFGEGVSLSLHKVFSLAHWDNSVTFPDGDLKLDPSKPVSERIEDVFKQIQYDLFVKKKISYRVQMQVPRRRTPGKFRWVEFEMWAAEDPIVGAPAILVIQTNLQDTKRMELDLKLKHEQLQSQNEQLQVELKKAQGTDKKIDLNSAVDRTLDLLNGFMAGKSPSQVEVERLKRAFLKSKDLRAPDKLEEVLLSNSKGFGGDVGLSLLELLKGDSADAGVKSIRQDSAMSGSLKESKQSRGESWGSGFFNNSADMMDRSYRSEPEELSDSEKKQQMQALLKSLDTSAALQEVLETADEWFFDAFELDRISGGHPLSIISLHIMIRLNLLDTFGIDKRRFFAAMLEIENGYPDNAYHNRTHAANVVQSMYAILTRGLGPAFLGDHEIFACMLAAIVHDYQHKGVNNDFLVRFQDDLALKYNDKSPLENHHISAAFHLLLSEKYNIFANISVDQFVKIRKLMIEMVLATDMKSHFEILGRFRLVESKICMWDENLRKHERTIKRIATDSNRSDEDMSPAALEYSSEEENVSPSVEDITLSLQVAMKCADIGHVYCSPGVHLKWVQKLEQELFTQGDKEKELGLVHTSPLMDREKAGITKSQCGFFQIVVLPLFQSFTAAFPELSPVTESICNNLDLWRQIEEEQLELSEVFDIKP